MSDDKPLTLAERRRGKKIRDAEKKRYAESKKNEKPLVLEKVDPYLPHVDPDVKGDHQLTLVKGSFKSSIERTPEEEITYLRGQVVHLMVEVGTWRGKYNQIATGVHLVITNRQNKLLQKMLRGEYQRFDAGSSLERPEFFPHPKIGMRKCPCKDSKCDRFWLTGIGTWVEGYGLALDDARDFVEYLNKFPENITLLANMDHPNYKGPK